MKFPNNQYPTVKRKVKNILSLQFKKNKRQIILKIQNFAYYLLSELQDPKLWIVP